MQSLRVMNALQWQWKGQLPKLHNLLPGHSMMRILQGMRLWLLPANHYWGKQILDVSSSHRNSSWLNQFPWETKAYGDLIADINIYPESSCEMTNIGYHFKTHLTTCQREEVTGGWGMGDGRWGWGSGRGLKQRFTYEETLLVAWFLHGFMASSHGCL